MPLSDDHLLLFLRSVHPYDTLSADNLAQLAGQIQQQRLPAGHEIYQIGTPLQGLYLIHDGGVEITDAHGATVSRLGPRNSFGERGLLRDGQAATTARTTAPSLLLMLPAVEFRALIQAQPQIKRYFSRGQKARSRQESGAVTNTLATVRVDQLMARNPQTCAPGDTVQSAAQRMHGARISSLCVKENGQLCGIVTLRDLSGKVVANALPGHTPVADVMTANPLHLPPQAIGSDVLHAMMEHRIGHIPIVQDGQLVGIVTQTDLTRHQALSSAELVGDIAKAATAQAMAKVTARIPALLAQLVASGSPHQVVTRLITDIADTATRRLLALAEAQLGAPPAPYLWLACGSQGRQEQTGVSDQDNCLLLDDAATPTMMPYFADLAQFVCDGLDAAGYFYCPGQMMATNPKWCQPLRVWRGYFASWIAKPDPMAQMLASVMFDLRPIGGHMPLFDQLQGETLLEAGKNSIFVAHMIANSLKHTPPLGLFRGFATLRSGEHKDHLDLKHNGVVPVVDLGRIYALQGGLPPVNTRARLQGAQAAGLLSQSGGRDLLDAYDLIAETRLAHQAQQVRAGQKPDNFLPPATLSEFERSHLRDAFVIVKTMQSALGHGQGGLL